MLTCPSIVESYMYSNHERKLSNLNASFRHTLRAAQPAREELHDRHHLIAVAGHAVASFAVTLDFHKLEQPLELVLRSGSHSRAIGTRADKDRSLAL